MKSFGEIRISLSLSHTQSGARTSSATESSPPSNALEMKIRLRHRPFGLHNFHIAQGREFQVIINSWRMTVVASWVQWAPSPSIS